MRADEPHGVTLPDGSMLYCGACDVCLAPAIAEGERALAMLRKTMQERARRKLRAQGRPLLRLVKKPSP